MAEAVSVTDDRTYPSLTAGDARLLVDLDGGIVARWAISGRDIFRPLPADMRDVSEKALRSGCFPLAPYCNRIAAGRFEFDGRRYQLPLNFGDHPHAIHGIAWQRRWALEDRSSNHLAIGLAEPTGDWPWAFSARQTFRLAADSLEIAIELTNRSERAMPAGIGLHPYFADPDGGRAAIAADAVWLTDQSGIPVEKARYPAALPTAPDNCLTGWSGRTSIIWPDRRLELSARDPFDHLHYYRPADADFICLEPVSHAPNALNGTGAPMAILGPGETLSGAVRMEIR